MTFIPANQIKVGSRVRITRDEQVLAGTFLAGTEFTITGSSYRGWDMVDDDGNVLAEYGVVGGNHLELVK